MLSKFGDLTAYDDNKIVLKFIKKIFSFERYILNNISFPFGISILYLGKKK